jgi:hypothetical protein
MAFSDTLRGLLRSAIKSPEVQKAGVEVISGIGSQILKNAHDPEAIKKLGQGLVENAPAVIGAIVKDTPAEKHVDPAAIKAAETAIGHGPGG